jgi:hypothetical protein
MFVFSQALTIGASYSVSDARVWELCIRLFFVNIAVIAASTGFVSIYAPVVMIAALRTFLSIDIGSHGTGTERTQMQKRVKRNIAKLRFAGSVNFVFFATLLIACVVVLLSPAALFGMRYGAPIFSHSAAFLIGLNSLMFFLGGVRHRLRSTTSELGRRDFNAGRALGRSDAHTHTTNTSNSHTNTKTIPNTISGASVLGYEPGPEVLCDRFSATVVPTSPA